MRGKESYQQLAPFLHILAPTKFPAKFCVCGAVISQLSRRTKWCSDECAWKHRRPNGKHPPLQRKRDSRPRRGRDSKEQKAKRARKIYVKFRMATEIIKELGDERAAVSQLIKTARFDPGQSG
jgi:hypothetical protein